MALPLFQSICTVGECLVLAVVENGMEKGLIESLEVLEQPGRASVFPAESLHKFSESFSLAGDSLPEWLRQQGGQAGEGERGKIQVQQLGQFLAYALSFNFQTDLCVCLRTNALEQGTQTVLISFDEHAAQRIQVDQAQFYMLNVLVQHIQQILYPVMERIV